MLKIKLDRNDQGPLLVFGLSDMNIAKLKEGKPIQFNLSALGEKGEVLIFHGTTEQAMMDELVRAGMLPAAAVKGRPQ